jgi:hypothetical protein
MKVKLAVSTNIAGKLYKAGDEVEIKDDQLADFQTRGIVVVEKKQQESKKDEKAK